LAHAHVTEPHKMYKGKHLLYGLGNFVFDYDVPIDDTRNFYFLKFTLEECSEVVDFQVYDGRINEENQPGIVGSYKG